MPRVLTTIGKIISVILIVLAIVALLIYFFVLQYPKLGNNPKQGARYRVPNPQMACSDGSPYRALYKQGSAKRVLVYFAGGGVSINEETAASDFYNKSEVGIDALANLTMNIGGIASDIEGNPFADWTVIAFPYATGDFHVGTGDFPYTDQNGQQRTLRHHGYTNFRTTMDLIRERVDLSGTEAVVATGYSAGGFGAALLAQDIFGDYFPHAASKTVFVDGALLTYDGWREVTEDIWHAPTEIVGRLATDNIVLDSLIALHGEWGDATNILFTCSTRDGDLSKVQHYLDDGVMEVDEAQISVAQWLADAVEGKLCDVGLELIG